MKLIEALLYARRHHDALHHNRQAIIGVAHTPNDEDATFYITELRYSPEVVASEDTPAQASFYKVLMEGGVPLRGEFIEAMHTHHSAFALAREVPAFAADIDYQVCKLKGYHFGGLIHDGLQLIFPNLPSLEGLECRQDDNPYPDTLYDIHTGDAVPDFSLADYTSYAARLVAKGNSQYVPPVNEPTTEPFYL